MQHLRKPLLALLSIACLCLVVGAAFAVDGAAPAAQPAVVPPLLEQLFSYFGMAAVALSTLATILPRTWKLTQVFARLSTDIRGILTPDEADDPQWAKRTPKDTGSLIVFAALLALPGCAFFRDTVAPVALECAPGRQYVIEELAAILSGADAFDVLDGVKNEKGADFVMCALQGFLDRVAVSPETAPQRARARAYIQRG